MKSVLLFALLAAAAYMSEAAIFDKHSKLSGGKLWMPSLHDMLNYHVTKKNRHDDDAIRIKTHGMSQEKWRKYYERLCRDAIQRYGLELDESKYAGFDFEKKHFLEICRRVVKEYNLDLDESFRFGSNYKPIDGHAYHTRGPENLKLIESKLKNRKSKVYDDDELNMRWRDLAILADDDEKIGSCFPWKRKPKKSQPALEEEDEIPFSEAKKLFWERYCLPGSKKVCRPKMQLHSMEEDDMDELTFPEFKKLIRDRMCKTHPKACSPVKYPYSKEEDDMEEDVEEDYEEDYEEDEGVRDLMNWINPIAPKMPKVVFHEEDAVSSIEYKKKSHDRICKHNPKACKSWN